jgi:hypothetical protein
LLLEIIRGAHQSDEVLKDQSVHIFLNMVIVCLFWCGYWALFYS